MSSQWLKELADGKLDFSDSLLMGFYCPYTNDPTCAMDSGKDVKSRELCEAIECDHLQFRRQKQKTGNRS